MYAQVLKANPYHDATGRFTTEAGATLVSVGGVFDKQRENQKSGRLPSASEQLTRLAGMRNLDFFQDDSARTGLAILHGKGVNVPDLVSSWLGEWHKPGLSLPKLYVTNEGLVSFKSVGGEHFGAKVGLYKRVLFPDTMTAYHEYLELKEENQGAGAVKKMFSEVVPAYERNNIKRIDLHANLDMGAYAWGRYGFTAKDPDEFRSEYQKGMVRLSEGAKSLGIELSDEARSELRGLRKSLLDHQGSKYITHTMTDAKTPALDWELRELFPDSHMTYTKAVLKDAHWMGEIDLKDEVAMKRLHKYIAKNLLTKTESML